jgi:TRAP-type mannitol/chloroaromatic compound transport system permease large subunit
MLRYGYNRSIATGVITASGTLAQIIPPSLVLIVMADQLGRSVGDMYAGAVVPGLILVGLFSLFIIALAIFRPAWVPALPPEACIYKEENGASGHRSLLVLLIISTAAAFIWAALHDSIINPLVGREGRAPLDETITMAVTVASFTALALALANRWLRLKLFSKLTERVVFVLLPPLVLIFLVLGTIFIGVATPTEGGAMGAMGALVMAVSRRRLSLSLLKQALDQTAKLTCFVIFILIGATFFSFTFNAADGHIWVEHLFDKLPGGIIGFLIAVNVLVFILGCFIDFFEIAFIVIPLLMPVANKLGIDLVWFGVVIAMNLQTSFLSPPFGFSLFYLRSVAPRFEYIDKITNRRIEAVTTAQIYKGSILFVALQAIMLALVISFPSLVTSGIDKAPDVNLETMKIEAEPSDYGSEKEEQTPTILPEKRPEKRDDKAVKEVPVPEGPKEEDPMDAVMRAIEKDKKK